MTTLSLNAPVPNGVVAVADDLSPALSRFDRVRSDHTLVVKRLGTDARPRPVRERLRTALAGVPPFEARLDGLGVFERPPAGPGPVLYFAVDSPGLVRVHEALLEAFPPVAGLEGEGYVPHVTVARGGDPGVAADLRERSVPSVAWTVDRLHVYDADYEEVAADIRLPP